MSRIPFVGGNWKCNGTLESVKTLVDGLKDRGLPSKDKCEVLIAPPAIHLLPALEAAKDSPILVSAQNCNFKGNGAYTGEVSVDMLVDAGIEWIIIGHSERRHVFKETNEFLSEKTKYALSKPNVKVVFCIGELLEEREAGKTIDVCKEQLEYLSKAVEDWDRIVIAYEPVWAIGTGKVATTEQAQEVHKVVRDWLSETVSKEVASRMRIIYGGSVNGKNCADLSRMPDIDGFLVGGASLKPEFTEIVNIIASVKAE